MVDFRYHLVSLISVFLALAVGIVLGAGPLQGALGSQLVEQVESLRTERNEYRDELTTLTHDSDLQHSFIAAAGPLLAANTLNHRNIAIVLIGDVDDIDERQIVQQIRLAGGNIVETASVSQSWFADDDANLREQAAAGLRTQLGGLATSLGADDTPTQTLSTALALALTQRGLGGERGADTQALDSQLAASNLVEFDGQQEFPADAILILTGALPHDDETDTAETQVFEADIPAAMARVTPVVVAGPTSVPGDLVDAVLNERRVADRVSTVNGTETEMGQIQVALVLAARIAGNVGHYGFGEGAAVLPPIVPTVISPPEETDPLPPTSPENEENAEVAGEDAVEDELADVGAESAQ